MKQCSKCKEWKDKSEFYKASKRKDGLQSHCKTCNRENVMKFGKTEKAKQMRRRYRQTEKFKEYNRISTAEYRQTKNGKEIISKINKSEKGKERELRRKQTEKYKIRHRKDSQKYKERYPEKVEAHKVVMLAIKQGVIPKPTTLTCRCGEQAKHYHHHRGYTTEYQLDVIPLCIKCHAIEHNNQKPPE